MKPILAVISILCGFCAHSALLIVVDDGRPTGRMPRFALASFKSVYESCVVASQPQAVVSGLAKASKEFIEKRHWTEEFAASRLEIAERFWPRSRYAVIHDLENNNEVVAILGVTTAHYDSQSLKNRESLEILPEEETLAPLLLPRPLDSRGKGVIIEIRAYFIEKEHNRKIRKYLLPAVLEIIEDIYRDFPELRDANVVNTYNDLTGLHLYSPFGMTLINEITPLDKPIMAKGSSWWTLANSPNGIEARTIGVLSATAKKYLAVYGFKQPMHFRLPGMAKKILADPSDSFSANYVEGTAEFTLGEPYVLKSGIILPKGSRVNFDNGDFTHSE